MSVAYCNYCYPKIVVGIANLIVPRHREGVNSYTGATVEILHTFIEHTYNYVSTAALLSLATAVCNTTLEGLKRRPYLYTRNATRDASWRHDLSHLR